MNLPESFRISWRAIRSHKLRSALTTLGVIIGIGAVITFLTLGLGLQAGIVGDLTVDDQRSVYIWAAPAESSGQGPLAGAQPVFTQRDADELEERPAIETAYVFTRVPGQAITYRGETIARQGGIIATGPDYFDGDDIATGRVYESGKREAVINPALASQFATNVSVGDTLTVEVFGGTRINVTVVGMLEDSESMSAYEGFDPASRLYLPPEIGGVAVQSSDEAPRYISVIAEAQSKGKTDIRQAKQAARAYLNSSASDAKQRSTEDMVFELKTSTELLGQIQSVIETIRNFIVGIAAISLLVGAIGIANIMLVSVRERTREIGIMKAVGAQRRDVIGLFLIEATILGLIGAIFGVLLGIVGGWVFADFVGVPYVFPAMWAGIAIVVGVLVGVVAGLYPAWNAAKTDPIDALRYE